MTTLVAGGTGRLGRVLVAGLLESARPLRVLTRSEESARALRAAGVEAVVGRAEGPKDAAAAVSGCSTVIAAMSGFGEHVRSSVRSVDGAGNLELIRAAEAAGVRRFVLVSGTGAAARATLELDRMKHSAERALRGSRLEWAVVRSAPFLETQLEAMGAPLGRTGRTLVFGPAESVLRLVPVQEVAAVVLRAAAGEHDRQVVELLGSPTSRGAMSDALHRAAGTAGRTRRVPLTALRLIAVLGRPFDPFLARAAGAAVVLATHEHAEGITAWGAEGPAPALLAAAAAAARAPRA